jgi:hypothetical protein
MVLVPVPTFEKVMVPVPVPTLEKFRFWVQRHIYTIKSKFPKKILEIFLPFYIVSCFSRENLKISTNLL